jgi:PAS domain S-box-containing protein
LASKANLDEAAVLIHSSRAGRVAATVASAILGLMLAPWRVCAAWATFGLLLEVWGYFCTRRQHRGHAVNRAVQTGFAANFGLICLNWLALSVVFWLQGTLESQTCAAAIVAILVTLPALLVYQSMLAFLLVGAAPFMLTLAIVTIHNRLASWSLLPTGLFLLLGLGFSAGRAWEIPSAIASERKLREREMDYRIIADSITDVIARSNLDGMMTYLSPSSERMIGYRAEELSAYGLLGIVHPDDQERVAVAGAGVGLNGGEASVEYRMTAKDGRTVWAETRITRASFQGPDGPQEVVTVSRDITARKMLEIELTKAKEAAEAASAAKSGFLANMSHELRTPLNAVLGFSDILCKAADLNPDYVRYASLINDGGAALLAVVNNLLDYSRLDSGETKLELSSFDPTELARSIQDLLGPAAAARGVMLNVSGSPGLDVIADVHLIRRVMQNLISNALKFTERGEVGVLVDQAIVGPRRSRLRVEVTDSGIGMSSDQLARVFERFSQADESLTRRFGGTGLGLAICQRAVSLMGGRLGAESVLGEGSKIWFELEVEAVEAPRSYSGGVGGQGAQEQRLRVLVVDDVAANRELVSALLSPLDADVVLAADGAEALALARHQIFDVILMDLQMPVMDGLTATKAIRRLEDPRAASVPIVALTSNILPEQVARCFEAGMNDHVGKPIEPGLLYQALARLGEAAADAPMNLDAS